MSGKLGRLLLVSLMAAPLVVIDAAAGRAANCSERGIFLNQSGFIAYGSRGTIRAINHDLGTDGCNGPTVQTQLVILSSDALNWVEVGIRQWFSGSMQNKVFGEWGFYPMMSHVDIFDNVPFYSTPRFSLNNETGTFDWKIWWDPDPNNGVVFQLLARYNSMWDTHGFATGEIAKHGPTADAYGEEWSLKFKNSGGTWGNFTDLRCWSDSVTQWEWELPHLDTEYDVGPGPAYC